MKKDPANGQSHAPRKKPVIFEAVLGAVVIGLCVLLFLAYLTKARPRIQQYYIGMDYKTAEADLASCGFTNISCVPFPINENRAELNGTVREVIINGHRELGGFWDKDAQVQIYYFNLPQGSN